MDSIYYPFETIKSRIQVLSVHGRHRAPKWTSPRRRRDRVSLQESLLSCTYPSLELLFTFSDTMVPGISSSIIVHQSRNRHQVLYLRFLLSSFAIPFAIHLKLSSSKCKLVSTRPFLQQPETLLDPKATEVRHY